MANIAAAATIIDFITKFSFCWPGGVHGTMPQARPAGVRPTYSRELTLRIAGHPRLFSAGMRRAFAGSIGHPG
jgi:hypothetical protein